MSWLQIRLFGPYFSSFSTNSYGYYSQMSQNLASNIQIFASALIVRQAAREGSDNSSCLKLYPSPVSQRESNGDLTSFVGSI